MTEKPMMSERPCGACGEGTMRPADVSGFVMEHRDDPRVRVGEQLVLPVCDVCGDMALNAADTDALDAALERSYRRKRIRQQRALINDLRRGGLTQVQIERFASLSPGYLSKLRNGKIASGATFRLLYLLHQLRGEAVRAVSRIDPRLRDVAGRGSARASTVAYDFRRATRSSSHDDS